MSEFENFESAAAPEDPAAEFLAREQDQLAGLEDEVETSGQDVAQDILDIVESETQNLAASSESPAFGDAFGEAALGTTSGGEFGTVTTDFSDASFGATTEGGEGYSAISHMDTQRQEPEKILIWREEQKERLTKKDEESEVKKLEWRDAAKKELEDWYKHRNEQLEKTRANNREAEAVFVQDRDETTPGHEWEKICRLCEFNPKQSRNIKDISRFRSILLQLKQTPLVR